MPERTLTIDGVVVPRFLYGTAWKEENTQALVELAIDNGFRGIDTANQRKHYDEEAVGQAIAAALENQIVARSELFLQTKFTHLGGQDHRLPYDPRAPIAQQVEQSLGSSLAHLHTTRIDSYVLHGPSARVGLAREDVEAWRAMESLHGQGLVRLLGVSNVSAEQLEELCRLATTPPRFVQNRCYAQLGWDREVRAVCRAHGIYYQGFSLLTANVPVLRHPLCREIATRHGRQPTQVVFRLALELGMIPLTGTSSCDHMREDLEIFDFELSPGEVTALEQLAG